MSTLLYHSGALGDFITTLPALAYWKKRHPAEALTLLGNPLIGAFAKANGIISDVIDINDSRVAPLFSDCWSIRSAEFFSSFHAAIVFADDDSPFLASIKKSAISNIFSQAPLPSGTIHAIDYHLSLFARASILPENETIPVISPSQQSIIKTWSRIDRQIPFIALHPGSGSKRKNWPFDRFCDVADHFRSKGNTILWIKGPAEGDWVYPENDYRADNLDLEIVAALLYRSKIFIGNDSGISHLAAAVGCPTIAIFGSSNPMVWTPRGKSVLIIQPKQDCSPCHQKINTAPTCTMECFMNITVEKIIELSRQLL